MSVHRVTHRTRRLARPVAALGLVACFAHAKPAEANKPKEAPGSPPVAVEAALPSMPSTFVLSNDAFAADLYKRLGATPGNVFYSPASISTALAMTYAGAGGDTAKQMAKTLHFDLPAKDLHVAFAALLKRLDSPGGKNPKLSVANRIFSQNGMTLEKPFAATTHDQYGADVSLLDFAKSADASRKTINLWVEGKTDKKITNLLPEGVINADTRMVLANAIYFKGDWAAQFKKSETRDEPFFSDGKTSKKVPMMHQTLFARYSTTADASVLSLPYAAAASDRSMSMVIVLPKAVDGLAKVEAGLDGKQLDGLGKFMGETQVNLSFPKFKTTYTADLGKTLAAMGMPLAFSEGQADFSGMTKSDKLFISKVLHKAYVDVNEEGTEAAAATAVIMARESSAVPTPPVTFKADHPFLFMIKDDKTGAVLFMGRVADPAAA